MWRARLYSMQIDTTSPAFKSICAYVKSVPPHPVRRGRAWRNDPSGIALMVQQLISLGDVYAVTQAVGLELGMSGQPLRLFARGLGPSTDIWPELRAELTKIGVKWLRTKVDVVPEQPTKDAATPIAPATFAPINESMGTWRLDPDSQDIFVLTTTRLRYGTPEHRAKLHEVMLTLGVRK